MLPLVSSLLSTRVVAVFEAVGDVATERAVGPECRVPTRLGRDTRAHAALATLTARGGESRGERTAATFAARRPLRPRDGLRLALSAPGVRGAALRGRRVEHHVLRADAVRLAYAEPALLRARKCGARFPARGAGAPPAVRRARRVRRWEEHDPRLVLKPEHVRCACTAETKAMPSSALLSAYGRGKGIFSNINRGHVTCDDTKGWTCDARLNEPVVAITRVSRHPDHAMHPCDVASERMLGAA